MISRKFPCRNTYSHKWLSLFINQRRKQTDVIVLSLQRSQLFSATKAEAIRKPSEASKPSSTVTMFWRRSEWRACRRVFGFCRVFTHSTAGTKKCSRRRHTEMSAWSVFWWARLSNEVFCDRRRLLPSSWTFTPLLLRSFSPSPLTGLHRRRPTALSTLAWVWLKAICGDKT